MTEKQSEPTKTSKEENKEEKMIPEHQQKLGPPPRRTENIPKWLEYHKQKWKMEMEKRIGPTASLRHTLRYSISFFPITVIAKSVAIKST